MNVYDSPMNVVVLYFASGESLYAGAVLLLAAMAISPYLRHPSLLRLRSLATWLALALIVMACPPFAWVVDVISVAAFALWFFASNWSARGQIQSRLRVAATVPLLILLLVLPAAEFRHRRKPAIVGAPSNHLVVIGDSISAGIDPHVPAWPYLMQRATGVPVTNLARPGALTSEGLSMAQQVTPADRLVLLEIGGNDLLSGIPSKEFAQGLDAILSTLTVQGRTIVMFELPLLPHRIAYGRIQRRLAEKYGVWLIPKRYLIDVIGRRDATTDGLHLSSSGARHMASLVADLLGPVLKIAGAPRLTPTPSDPVSSLTNEDCQKRDG